MELAVALLTLITVPTTFFGWNYDQTILLIPIVQVFSWLSQSKEKAVNIGIIVVIGITLVVNYCQHFIFVNDLFYLWIPIFWWIIFGFGWYHFQRQVQAATEVTRLRIVLNFQKV